MEGGGGRQAMLMQHLEVEELAGTLEACAVQTTS